MGDCRTAAATETVAAAATRWLRRGGKIAWTYTHSWDRIPAFSWGDISTLASVDRKEDVAKADSRGYAVSIVAEKPQTIAGIQFFVCPAQTHKHITCEACEACFDAEQLRKDRKGVAFLPHGNRRKKIKAI
jgi:hypothetical protein